MLLQTFSCLLEGTRGVDNVVNDDGLLALHVAHHVHAGDLACPFSLLYDHGQSCVFDSHRGEESLEVFGSRHSSCIWGYYYDVPEGEFLLLNEVVHCDQIGLKIVDGDPGSEKSLDLSRVHID